MRFATTKGTSKIATTRVSGMGQKQYSAVPAAGQRFSQMGLLLDDRAKNPIILRHQTPLRSFAVPVGCELKKRLNLNYKNVKYRLMSLK
jgi:hypothetical protein